MENVLQIAEVTFYWEYALEFQHFPNLKRHPVVFSFGILLLILGEFIRKIAIITLGHNFTLRISVKQRSEHKLVTTGIFKYVRHPSYAGWYIWAIGMQVMIGNPFCTIFAMIVLWRFFKIRIEFEDVYLYHFFKDEWVLYRFNTPSGILFVK
ncbi:putative isoprenylcysteine carboxyl methyltransferase family protein [Monocercomonoides exilis]|uniref:putative isoprenylcysteine carboxyl methyltransferase family protein n=1 Tax=Monocercomonoides exilis TaxID=2049356 RepID=UPI00355A7A80|nr:putative isoprenylcysteine carboxyl methyltransferase family protein [Monocercomonoides exilis]